MKLKSKFTTVTNHTTRKNKVHETGSPEEANTVSHLALMVEQAHMALKAAQDYADLHGLQFSWDPDSEYNNSAYLHFHYQGRGNSSKHSPTSAYDWYDYTTETEDGWGWYTSSDAC